MRLRLLLVPLACLVVAVILQTTLFSRFSFVTPDLVLLVIILLATTDLPAEGVLVWRSREGLSSTCWAPPRWLRAAASPSSVTSAVKTAHRVDIGPWRPPCGWRR